MAAAPDLHLGNSTEIQGDILAGFNKDHRMYFFLSFPNQASGGEWLGELIPSLATTKDVAAFNKQFSAARAANRGVDPANLKATWVKVSLTYQGLKTLFKADPGSLLTGHGFNAFVAGPVAQANVNGDTLPIDAPKNWVVGRDEQNIHALLNIQSDDPYALTVEVQKLQALIKKHGIITVFEQPVATLPGALVGHEHFGFKDGVSQPGVANFDPPDPHDPDKHPSAPLGHVLGHPGTEIIAAGEFILGEPDEGGQKFAVPGLNWMVNGSFQVVRRFRQDVAGFLA
jgi:deferrochelatase/peroxidase EfeB